MGAWDFLRNAGSKLGAAAKVSGQGVATGAGYVRGRVGRGVKAAGITGLVVGGVAAIGILASRSRNRARQSGNEELANADLMQDQSMQPPAMMDPQQQAMMQQQQMAQMDPAAAAMDPQQQAAMQQQIAQSGPAQPMVQEGLPAEQMGPADGRAAGEWQARVAAERGMEAGQQQPGPNQPAQNVMPEESVQNLGASKEGAQTPQPTR